MKSKKLKNARRKVGFSLRVVSGYVFDPLKQEVDATSAFESHSQPQVFVAEKHFLFFFFIFFYSLSLHTELVHQVKVCPCQQFFIVEIF